VLGGDPSSVLSGLGIAGRPRRGTVVTGLAGRPPVLMYHGVGRCKDDPFDLFVTPECLAHQMRTLRVLGLRGVPLGRIGDAVTLRQAQGLVGLTFDDGYHDVLKWAVPILERYGFTATMFAVSGLLGGENVWDPPPRRRLVDEADLKNLAARGWEIGAHGVTHARLTDVDSDHLRFEVVGSRIALADVTGTEPRSFCYPYGSLDTVAVDAVRDAGYSYACAVRRVPGLHPPLAMPRIGVTERDWGPRFVAKLFLRGR
jgi:peptidoglycan/xylan/chitin deacetylase (PgdA/CDA1 family)